MAKGAKIVSAARKAPAAKSTAVKANRATVCGPSGSEKTVEVRKIANGYIVRESSYGGKSGYTSTERFTEKPPTIQIEPTKGK